MSDPASPLSALSRASTTLNRLAAAAGLMNGDYLGDRDEQAGFADEVLAAHAAIHAVMLLLRNHPELVDELDHLATNPGNVTPRVLR